MAKAYSEITLNVDDADSANTAGIYSKLVVVSRSMDGKTFNIGLKQTVSLLRRLKTC